jgi:hypothetical protein
LISVVALFADLYKAIAATSKLAGASTCACVGVVFAVIALFAELRVFFAVSADRLAAAYGEDSGE